MKWIGKNSTSDASLADITSVVAGTGLSGGGTRGSVTLNVDASIPEITTLAGLTSIGTISTGVWGATDIGIAHGGTGASTFSTGAVLIGNGTGSLVPTTPLQYFNDGAESNTSTLSILSNQDSGDKFTIATTTHGATTLTTIDDDATAAHFEIASDGKITLDAAAGIFLEPAAGSNILLDGTIAVDAGVVTGATSITSTAISCNIIQGTLSTASQPNVTGVGTIGTGVWEGTTIKTAYIGDDQVTEDKLANTLLAEIDANTAKVTNSDQSKSDIDGLGITTVGTIDTGVWNGTAIASARLDADTAHLTTAQTFTGSKTMATDVKLNFRDANAYIHSNAANDLAIVATDVEIAATNVILDAATAIKLEGNTTLAGNLSVTGTTHAFASSTANRPVFSILSTADDATSGTLRLWKNRGQDGGGGANENGDKIGVIEFLGGNDAQEPIYYGKILVEALEVDDTDEAGKVSLQVAESNGTVSGLTTGLLIEGSDNTTDGEVNVTIAAGADSLTTVVGNLTVNESLRAKQIFVKQGSYSIDAATSEVFFPMTGTAENVSAAGISIPMLAPANGKLLKIHFRSNKDHSGGNQTFKLINWDNNETFSVGNKSVLGTKAITGAATNNVITCDFTTGVTGTNEFTDGETIGLSVTNVVDIGAATKYWFTAVFEFDFSGY